MLKTLIVAVLTIGGTIAAPALCLAQTATPQAAPSPTTIQVNPAPAATQVTPSPTTIQVTPTPAPTSTAAPSRKSNYEAPGNWFIYSVIALVFIVIWAIFMLVNRALSAPGSTWSLSNALSEESDLTVVDANGNPVLNAAGEPVKKSVLVASTSRLIAFIGTFAILLLFLGFGAFLLWDFGKTGETGRTDGVTTFLLAGLTLFAPYIVNKFSSIFAPGK